MQVMWNDFGFVDEWTVEREHHVTRFERRGLHLAVTSLRCALVAWQLAMPTRYFPPGPKSKDQARKIISSNPLDSDEQIQTHFQKPSMAEDRVGAGLQYERDQGAHPPDVSFLPIPLF